MKQAPARLSFRLRLLVLALELILPFGIYFAMLAGMEALALVFVILMAGGIVLEVIFS